MSFSGASTRPDARLDEKAHRSSGLPPLAPLPTSEHRPLQKAIVGTAVGLGALYLGLYLVAGPGPTIGDTPWNVPTVYTFVALSSFLVAFVALGRYTVLRAPEAYWIGTAFAAFGLQSILFVLSWPGLRPDGSAILGRLLPATSAWIGAIELATLGGLLLAAALCRWPAPGGLPPRIERASVFAVLALATFPCVLVILLDRQLPGLIDARGRFSAASLVLNIALAVLFGVGALLSAKQYRQSGDALKGYVALTQIAWTFVMAGHVIGGKRYDAWYYLGRILQAGAAVTMLFGLLADYVGLLRRERARSAELQEAHRRLEEAHAKKDRYLSMLSHELRNPLAAIASATSVLGLRAGRFPELRRAADVAARQVRYMSRLLDDLLDVARITHGQIALRRETVDVRHSIATALEMVHPKIAARRHAVDLQLPPDPVLVNADPARIVQVVANLLDNAAKYTPDGGRVTVSARRDVDEVVITVRDNGVGIPAALRPHIFHAFERGQMSLGGAEGGLGLGLALVRELVDLHGGDVRFAEASPVGTEFQVRLPAVATDGSTLAKVGTASVAERRRLRVLVVDDNQDAADMLGLCLEEEGCAVTTATSGASAIDLALAHRPDLVLLDLSMPEIDGFRVAERLRAASVLRHTRVVAVSGHGGNEYRHRANAAGFTAYLVKPVNADALRDVLDSCRQTPA